MRMATPGKPLEPSLSHQLDFSGWKERALERWQAESGRDASTKGISGDEIPDNLWYYLYDRFLNAEKHYVLTMKDKKSWNRLGDL